MAGTTIQIDGLAECLRAINGLKGELKKNANGELRKASSQIARDAIPLLGGSSSPQEGAILAAAGPKSDRYVVIAVPKRRASLSGSKGAEQDKQIAWAMEAGSDKPQFHSPSPGSLVAQRRDAVARMAIPRYTRALLDIMRRYRLL